MPRFSRIAMRQQASATRLVGEEVTLLFSDTVTPSTTTPFSITESNTPPNADATKTQVIYAKVTFDKLGEYKEEEGGRAIKSCAKIECAAELESTIQGCFGVKLSNGTVYMKRGEGLSEDRTTYVLNVEGWISVGNA